MGRTEACDRHVETLLDVADGLEPDGDPDAARAHVERCDRCRQRLTDTLLVVADLRRIGRAARAAEPPPDSWDRLARRIRSADEGATRRVSRRVQHLGALVAPALLAALVGPTILGAARELLLGTATFDGVPGTGASVAPSVLADERRTDLVRLSEDVGAFPADGSAQGSSTGVTDATSGTGTDGATDGTTGSRGDAIQPGPRQPSPAPDGPAATTNGDTTGGNTTGGNATGGDTSAASNAHRPTQR